MKKVFKIASFALMAASVLAFTGCPKDDPKEEVTVSSLNVVTANATTSFAEGDEFTADGLVVKAKMSDGTSKTLSASEYDVTVPAANLDEDGNLQLSETAEGHSESVAVTVAYKAKAGITKTYNISVAEAPTALVLDVSAVPEKVNLGSTLDLSGVIVQADYAEGVEVVTDDAEVSATGFDSSTVGIQTVTIKAVYAGVEEEVTKDIEVWVDPNKIQNVEFLSAYLAPGWSPILNNVTSIEATDGKVSINGKDVSYSLAAGLTQQWQAQLLIETDASVEVGDYWYFSCKLAGVTGGYTIKLNNDESLIAEQKGTIESAEDGVVVLVGGKASVAHSDMPIMFDFGTCSEGTVVISNLTFEVVDIDEVEPVSVVLTPATSEKFEEQSVEYKAFLNGLYPIDVTYTTSETGVSACSVDGSTVALGNVTGDENGTVTVSATYNGVTGTATITVKKVEPVEDMDILPLITNINPGWGQAGSCSKTEVTDVDGYTGEVASFVNCNYQGWDVTTTDASLYKGIAVEYYTEDENINSIEVFPIGADSAGEYEISKSPITKGEWTTEKFEFAEGKDNIHGKIFQLKFNVNHNAGATGNFYIKAIYFYAED